MAYIRRVIEYTSGHSNLNYLQSKICPENVSELCRLCEEENEMFNNSSTNAIFPTSLIWYLACFKGAVDSWRETAVAFERGSIFVGSQFPTTPALDWSSTNVHAPSQGHANPCCSPRDPSWLAMECQSVWFTARWLQVWPRFKLLTPPMIPHQVEIQFFSSQPFPVSSSGLFPSPSWAPGLCWCGKCQQHEMETLTILEYPLQLGC